MPKVLIIDDNPEILSANASHFSEEGFTVTPADSGIKAMAALNEHSFDCIVLDILLPDLDGFAICKAARTVTDAPILFLSCLDDIDEKLKGLMIGDDYMTKPYRLRELSARVHALIRRSEAASDSITQTYDADFYIDRKKRLIHANGENVYLSQKEFRLFPLFYDNPAVLFSKEAILEEIWQKDGSNSGTIAVHVLKLRKKLRFAEARMGRIENRHGKGYRLAPPPGDRNKCRWVWYSEHTLLG